MQHDRADDLLRDLAAAVRVATPFEELIPDDAEAVVRWMTVVHKSRCPRCGSKNWQPQTASRIRCDHRCGEVSVYADTVWSRRTLGVRFVFAAVHAVFVDVATPTSRGFAKKMQLRLETAWGLLHDARAALPFFVPAAEGLRRQLLGFCNPDNAADVVVSFGSGRLTLTLPEDPVRVGCPEDHTEALRRKNELPIWWGVLRAWVTTTFRGVSRQHLWKYLAEFADRQGRVGRAALLST